MKKPVKALALVPALWAGTMPFAQADAKELKQVGKVTVDDGVINDALALDDGGGKLGWIHTDGKGNLRLHVGPATGKGGKAGQTVDLTKFTVVPERVYSLGSSWVVVANEGERKAAFVAGGKLKNQAGPFADCLVSTARGKAFVTFTEHGGKGGGRSIDIASYRPDGGLGGSKQVTIGPDGKLGGTGDLTFVGFTNGYLQALVRKAGKYNRAADVREGSQIAVYDVMTGRSGAGKNLPNIPRFLNLTQKRSEKPGVETFLRLDDDGQSFELVGPAEKLRPLELPTKFSLYEAGSLQQQMAGGKLVFSLTVDPLNEDQVKAQKKGERTLHLFVADLGSARATLLGEIPLGETQQYAWSAGGNKIAVLKKTLANGGVEISIFQR